MAKEERQKPRFLFIGLLLVSLFLFLFFSGSFLVFAEHTNRRGFVGLAKGCRSHKACILPGRPLLAPIPSHVAPLPPRFLCAANLQQHSFPVGSRRPMASGWDELSSRLDWASIQQC